MDNPPMFVGPNFSLNTPNHFAGGHRGSAEGDHAGSQRRPATRILSPTPQHPRTLAAQEKLTNRTTL